ncbi:hypothetical protein, partial [uncultured Kingella sp.]|uniref:hypothetical protein n=1 Tax=uncultured Kingella sp. TaxID=159270 RepID=UPI002594CAEB
HQPRRKPRHYQTQQNTIHQSSQGSLKTSFGVAKTPHIIYRGKHHTAQRQPENRLPPSQLNTFSGCLTFPHPTLHKPAIHPPHRLPKCRPFQPPPRKHHGTTQ